MNENTIQGPNGTAKAIGILALLECITFFLASLLHLGVPIPVGFSEPRILPATVVEGLIAVFLAVSVYAIFTHRPWAWLATTAAHGFTVAGVLLGIVATTLGPGPETEANTIYHRVTLVIAAAVLVFLLTPVGRNAFAGSDRA